ncbi:hypothetical protein SESBI_12241 [Sesbania bispinosa]|nr:hypothetical protein SESBI_12241 [Sesbania bispinosa]
MACTCTPLFSPPTTTTVAAVGHHSSTSLFPLSPIKSNNPHRRLTRLHVSSPTNKPGSTTVSTPPPQKPAGETIFFDGGAHYGDPRDRSDFSYDVIKEVRLVPRFIGEWGDVVLTLKDGTKVDLRSVPKFREIGNYCLEMSMQSQPQVLNENGPKGF